MDTTSLVRQAYAPNLPPLARGYIVPTRAAPATFTEGVFVVLPEGSTEHLYGPCKWGAIHGTTKPQPGEACVVAFDEQNQPTIVWWEGKQTEPTATGAAGGALEGTYPNPTLKAPEAWKAAPAFENSWENFEAGGRKAEYMKDPFGFVHLRGLIKTGTSNKAAFTLPAGYRPKNKETFAVAAATDAANVNVETTGTVMPQDNGGSSVTTFVFLDNVIFSVE